ncbi:hypothetical protein PpBr36_07289 [Pyricularia pennisetigena]|uniref:hypothetical protein n=1 Tax=Pyricularia pennisetigena TaxID=1578925 RepID=UPI001150BAC2|nr:hypothetical protein PpBr36_07289 [Pyricularia pennisetigena]TLS25707.1 hypothetical protein PpBr36_07289 [Pyricularia pennisetigena]
MSTTEALAFPELVEILPAGSSVKGRMTTHWPEGKGQPGEKMRTELFMVEPVLFTAEQTPDLYEDGLALLMVSKAEDGQQILHWIVEDLSLSDSYVAVERGRTLVRYIPPSATMRMPQSSCYDLSRVGFKTTEFVAALGKVIAASVIYLQKDN